MAVPADAIATLTHATERDVDLLLVEEFKCSPDFVRWFAGKVASAVGKSIKVAGSAVSHSRRRTYNRREIDIALELRDSRGRSIHLLIENKLDTSEQFEQAESYRSEVQLLVQSPKTAAAYTILVCPRAYAKQHGKFASKFDAGVSYEEISQFLGERIDSSGELMARLEHKRELLEQATTKARRGYQAVPLPAIEQFNAKYVALAKQVCPELKPGPSMLKEGRPGESKTMVFAPECLPDWDFLPQMRIVHQLREGNANVNFYGWGDHFTHLAAVVGADLMGTPYRLVPTMNKRAGGKSGMMIVMETPSIDNIAGFDAQRALIEEGIEATGRLRAWVWSSRDVIRKWAASIPNAK